MGFSPIGEFSCSRHNHDTLGVGPINTADEALRTVRCVRSIDERNYACSGRIWRKVRLMREPTGLAVRASACS